MRGSLILLTSKNTFWLALGYGAAYLLLYMCLKQSYKEIKFMFLEYMGKVKCFRYRRPNHLEWIIEKLSHFLITKKHGDLCSKRNLGV